MRADGKAFVGVIILAAGVAIGWTLGNLITRKLGLT